MFRHQDRTILTLAVSAALALPLTPSESQAETTLVATKIFSVNTNEDDALAADLSNPSAVRLYIANGATLTMNAYDLGGSLVAGPIDLDDTIAPAKWGLHFLREATSLGAVALPVGTLMFMEGGSKTLYAINKTTGDAITGVVLDTTHNVEGGCQPLSGRAQGIGYSTLRDRFFSIDPLCLDGVVAEVNLAGVVTGHFETSVNLISFSDVKEHPRTRNLWVCGGSTGIDISLSEYTNTGAFIREFRVSDPGDVTRTPIKMAFDATGSRLWFLTAAGEVYQLDGPAIAAVPAVGHWGSLLLVLLLLLGSTGMVLGRRALHNA